MYNENNFIEAIAQSFANYLAYGSRSTQKLKPIHLFLAETLQNIFGKDYDLHYDSKGYAINPKIVYQRNYKDKKKGEPKDEPFKELKVTGKYYDKNVDVAITKNGNSIFCLGIKFVTSNYEQNSNNYFEAMLGETLNLQSKSIPYAHLTIFRKHTPYYKKSDTGETKKLEKTETVAFDKLKKYVELDKDTDKRLRPFATALFFIDICDENDKLIENDFDSSFDVAKSKINKIELIDIDKQLEHLSIEKLFEKIKYLVTK